MQYCFEISFNTQLTFEKKCIRKCDLLCSVREWCVTQKHFKFEVIRSAHPKRVTPTKQLQTIKLDWFRADEFKKSLYLANLDIQQFTSRNTKKTSCRKDFNPHVKSTKRLMNSHSQDLRQKRWIIFDGLHICCKINSYKAYR